MIVEIAKLAIASVEPWPAKVFDRRGTLRRLQHRRIECPSKPRAKLPRRRACRRRRRSNASGVSSVRQNMRVSTAALAARAAAAAVPSAKASWAKATSAAALRATAAMSKASKLMPRSGYLTEERAQATAIKRNNVQSANWCADVASLTNGRAREISGKTRNALLAAIIVATSRSCRASQASSVLRSLRRISAIASPATTMAARLAQHKPPHVRGGLNGTSNGVSDAPRAQLRPRRAAVSPPVPPAPPARPPRDRGRFAG